MTFVVTEGVSGGWHYHVSDLTDIGHALCGAHTMYSCIDLDKWRVQFGEHFPKPSTWCETCEKIAGIKS